LKPWKGGKRGLTVKLKLPINRTDRGPDLVVDDREISFERKLKGTEYIKSGFLTDGGGAERGMGKTFEKKDVRGTEAKKGSKEKGVRWGGGEEKNLRSERGAERGLVLRSRGGRVNGREED